MGEGIPYTAPYTAVKSFGTYRSEQCVDQYVAGVPFAPGPRLRVPSCPGPKWRFQRQCSNALSLAVL